MEKQKTDQAEPHIGNLQISLISMAKRPEKQRSQMSAGGERLESLFQELEMQNKADTATHLELKRGTEGKMPVGHTITDGTVRPCSCHADAGVAQRQEAAADAGVAQRQEAAAERLRQAARRCECCNEATSHQESSALKSHLCAAHRHRAHRGGEDGAAPAPRGLAGDTSEECLLMCCSLWR